MISRRDIAFLLLGAVVCIGLQASAVDESALEKHARFEVGYGKCRGSGPDEGTWQQRDLPHQLKLSDQCGEGGMLWSLNHDVSLGARFVNFGEFATYAIANNDPEDKSALRGSVSQDHTRAECLQRGSKFISGLKEDCSYRWTGSGHLWGGLFNIAWHPLHLGDLKIGGEAGLVIYKATWRMVIQPLDYGWQYQYDQRTGWQHAPEFGASAYYKWAYAAYRFYMVPDGAPITPAYRSPVRQFVLGLSVPFSL